MGARPAKHGSNVGKKKRPKYRKR